MRIVIAACLICLAGDYAVGKSPDAGKPSARASVKPVKNAELEDILSHMDAVEKNVRDIQFKFKQDVFIAVTKETQTVRGRAIFKRPEKFYVEHFSPKPYKVICDGKNIYAYSQQQNQVVVTNAAALESMGRLSPGVLNPAGSIADLRKRYEMRVAASTCTGRALDMTLKEQPDFKMRMMVSTSTWLPESFEIKTKTLRVSTVLEETEINPGVADDKFVFEIPSGATVIREP